MKIQKYLPDFMRKPATYLAISGAMIISGLVGLGYTNLQSNRIKDRSIELVMVEELNEKRKELLGRKEAYRGFFRLPGNAKMAEEIYNLGAIPGWGEAKSDEIERLLNEQREFRISSIDDEIESFNKSGSYIAAKKVNEKNELLESVALGLVLSGTVIFAGIGFSVMGSNTRRFS